MIRRPPRSTRPHTLFPYTTPFRSQDIAAFELDGRRDLLVADTGDNGGLRRSLQLHAIEEPTSLDEVAQHAPLEPAWSIAFRWPDGARDCEAVAVDAQRGEVLLISKKRTPPELFALPDRKSTRLNSSH